jgi:hypothetical protein
MRIRLVLPILLLAVASAAMAQTAASVFAIRSVQPNLTQNFENTGNVAFTTEGIGISADAQVTVTYRPALTTLTATIVAVDLTGPPDFTLSSSVDYSTGQYLLTNSLASFGFALRYKPLSSKAVTAKLTFTYQETDTASVRAFTGNRIGTFTINLTGSTAEFVYSYAVQPSGNSTNLNQGDTIALPAVNLTETSAVAITVANRGTAAGTISGVSMRGPATFALANVPFPPITVDAGKSLVFSVRLTPDVLDAVRASVQVDLPGNRGIGFQVTGSGLGAQYVYQAITARGARDLDANSTVVLPDATIGGEKTTITIKVSNVGNADGRIAAISVAGTGFAIAESPFLPYAFPYETSFTVVVSFTATQPGKSTGRLRIGNDNFNVEATALGPSLTYSFAAGGGSTTIQSPGTVVFTPVNVGETSTAQFTIRNEGTAQTLVNSISVTGTGTTFATGTLPRLPITLAPGAGVTFNLTFTPVTVGANTGTLRIDTNTFTLSGSAGPPAALPAYTFSGATGAQQPQEQPAVGFSLNAVYPLALSGTLTLAFNSDVFANDPAVQFSTGGRTIPFTIPANSRQAVFPNGASQMRIQTGTVAGTITLTPSFSTTTGGIDMTPQNPPSLNLTVAQSAPKLLSVVISTRTANSFTLLVTGYATGRSITQMDFTFSPTSGERVSTSKITLAVEPTFLAWYQGTGSAQFGSLFTATVPFTLAGDIVNTTTFTNVIDTIQSVAVTIANRQGTSASTTVNLK